MTAGPDLAVEPFFCSAASLAAGEALTGTASRARVWFMLEYRGAYGRKAFEESDLPAPVKAHLAAARAAIPDARILLIKSQTAESAQRYNFFIALSEEHAPALYHFELPDYTVLTSIDLAAVARRDPQYDHALQTEPLFLVCTNGRRDACCAKFGLPVFIEALRHAGPRVWQSSHVGGHRFAANLVCFPHGLYYGRVAVAEVRAILDAYRQGRLYLPLLRGRAVYPEAAQAGETLLREQTGVLDVEAYRLSAVTQTGPEVWQVEFAEPAAGRTYQLFIQEQRDPLELFQSCSQDKSEPVRRYRVAG